MTPLASYRRLFQLAGPTYVVVAFLARLPLAMSQLGTLLLVSTATGSYGLGGLSAGALAVANAVGAPFAGLARRPDRPAARRARPVPARRRRLALLVAVVAATSADVAVVLGRRGHRPGCCPRSARWRACAGARSPARPAPTSAASSTWPSPTRVRPTRRPSRSARRSSVSASPSSRPTGALLLAAALLAVFGSAFALDPSARLAHARERTRSRRAGCWRRPSSCWSARSCSIGTLFGATQTGTTVLATDVGTPGRRRARARHARRRQRARRPRDGLHPRADRPRATDPRRGVGAARALGPAAARRLPAGPPRPCWCSAAPWRPT